MHWLGLLRHLTHVTVNTDGIELRAGLFHFLIRWSSIEHTALSYLAPSIRPQVATAIEGVAAHVRMARDEPAAQHTETAERPMDPLRQQDWQPGDPVKAGPLASPAGGA